MPAIVDIQRITSSSTKLSPVAVTNAATLSISPAFPIAAAAARFAVAVACVEIANAEWLLTICRARWAVSTPKEFEGEQHLASDARMDPDMPFASNRARADSPDSLRKHSVTGKS